MIEYQHFSEFSKTFERSGLYNFQAVASSESIDKHGTKFEIASLRPAVPYLPIHIEHDDQPVGSVIEYWRDGDQAKIAGAIDVEVWPDLVKSIKSGHYSGVSIGGAYNPEQVRAGFIRNAIINEISLTNSPSNPDALIYKRNKPMKNNIDPLKYLGLSNEERVNFFKSQGFSEKMSLFIVEGITRAMH